MKRYESKKWYFHPTIFIKILWLLFSVAILGIFTYFSVLTLDPFFRTVVGNTNGVVLVLAASITLVSIISGLLANCNVFKGSQLIYVFHVSISVVLMVVSVIFIASYGTVSVRAQAFQTIYEYVKTNKNNTETDPKIQWFSDHVLKITKHTNDHEIHQACEDYADDRTEDAGSCTLGGICVWLLFSCLMFYVWFTDQHAPAPLVSVTSAEGMSQYNEKILNSNIMT
ncbi:hypothetical protein TRFO_29701 [Tritrichomonas foetus]|uniref:Tetraspanin family protein n=1 Tax=Tritrichomonas foetus TaxID=1144522 RepID=A0A1J4JV32_9EUKA|nr:hypothetical protein TRFO_29701 [Tritrichomonas foetus]|eukprot:OHT03001.1 hypothetical protein TRFO_29701 [Tritrichomonas foetus]